MGDSAMNVTITITINGQPCRVPAGTVVAAAIAQTGLARFCRSVTGEPRAPLCGMGICHECRVTIDGRRQLACQTVCRDGMRIDTATHRP